MEPLVFLWVVIAIAAFLGARHFFRSRAGITIKPAAPAASRPSTEAAAASDTPAPSESAELYRLSEEIEAFVEKSAYPRELVAHPTFKKAVAILAKPEVPLETLRQYATGANWPLGCAALEVLAENSERTIGHAGLLAQFAKFRPWHIYFALRYFARMKDRPPLGAPVAQAQHWWSQNLVLPDSFRDYFIARAADTLTFGGALDDTLRADPEHIDLLLSKIDHPSARALRSELATWLRRHIDRQFLNAVGRFWGDGVDETLLVEPAQWTTKLDEAQAAIENSTPRSVVAVGEGRVGKTSFLKLLGKRLTEKGWTIFEASGSELQAGQKYIGELEGRIRKVVAELNAEKRVVWYVPDLLQIAESGTHSGQTASILDQILPALTGTRLIIMTEASPAGITRLVQMRPAVRSIIEIHRLNPMSVAETADLASRVSERIEESAAVALEPAALATVLQLAEQYLGSTRLPGTTLDLLKSSANQALAGNAETITVQHVFDTLSQATGLPRSILDDDQRMDLAAVRIFFAARVIGQDEAVGAMVDRIAMLKAGLTDPKRPIGVFLFAGPTGTGKTELAKTLAEYLFGSADRMTRLDMSEFQAQDSTAKIVGGGGADSLADRIRKQPFSVVLLDEFEKAHPNAWDLFLQVFDDGRLSDATGREVDFRHTIIILTSNLGAAAQRGTGIGFARTPNAYSEDNVLEAVSRTFRPEFVNRLDKIIVFRPLSRLLMRDILLKELRLVLDRRGLKSRDWAVEWEDSAMEFLLDKGFSPEMGARPLRRAIDQHLLAPLAATLVEHRYPAGDQFLFVRSDGESIEVEFVDPDRDEPDNTGPSGPGPVGSAAGPEAGIGLAAMILNPIGSDSERAALASAIAEMQTRLASESWLQAKNTFLAETGDAGFWSRPDRFAVFARLSLIDRVDEAARTAERLFIRLGAASSKSGHASRDMISRLALQVHLVGEGIVDVSQSAPVDALLKVERALDAGSDVANTNEWLARITQMYRGWAKRRHMQIHEIKSASPGDPVILQIAGFGAYRTLAGEAGLHILEGDEREGDRRIVARVAVVAGGLEDPPAVEAYRRFSALLSQAAPSTVVRRYRDAPAPLVRDSKQGWRSGRLESVLRGDFDLLGEVEERTTTV